MTDVQDRTEPRRHPADAPHQLSWDADPDRGPITREFAVTLMRALVAEAGDRPGWSPLQVMTAFDELRDQERADLRRAAYAILDRPGSTAEEIALTGEHWAVVVIPSGTPRPREFPDVEALSAYQQCPKHPDVVWTECRVCRPLSKGRDESWWAERDRVAAEDKKRRQRLAEAEEADRIRRQRLGVPEPRHG